MRWIKISTDIPKLQDVQGPKHMAAPHTALIPRPICLIFWLRIPMETLFKLTVAIFEYPPLAQVMGVRWSNLATLASISQATGGNSKVAAVI